MSFYNKFVFNYIDNKKWELKMGEQIVIDPNVLIENIKESERAKERGETKVYTIEELKEELEITEEDLKEVEDVELE